ncbi:hypothetical protein BDZ45DRAFT_724157 [Acephala macrosclerotiorum]|nr:hypothetical protein BDZ45DRAFT_724157 [Acephala macrosclerotiorum]
MSSSNGQQTTNGPRRRKRIITDARKEQNRTAQQLYRPISLETNPLESGGRLTANGVEATTETRSRADALFSEDTPQLDSVPSLNSGFILQGIIPDFDFNIDETMPLPISSTCFSDGRGSGLLDDSVDDGTTIGSSSMVTQEKRTDFMSGHSASNFPDASLTNRFLCAASSSSIWPASMNATPLHSYEPANIQLCSPTSMKISTYSPQIAQQNRLEDHEDSWNPLKDAPFNQIPGAKEMIYSTAKFVYGRQISSASCNASNISLPDSHINAILCSLGATLLAYFHNAHCIGLKPQDVLVNRSPFYKPNSTAADDPQALLAAARKPWIPNHLQPTLPQILFPHHLYLDLLPFPALRARAITFGASNPQFFNAMEFKKDVFRDGIHCIRDLDRGGSRQPWGMRSWEAAPWFVKK